MSPNYDLDAAGALPQCQAYTEELVSVGTYLELWDEFGVVADLVVRLLIFIFVLVLTTIYIHSRSLMIFLTLIFAS